MERVTPTGEMSRSRETDATLSQLEFHPNAIEDSFIEIDATNPEENFEHVVTIVQQQQSSSEARELVPPGAMKQLLYLSSFSSSLC